MKELSETIQTTFVDIRPKLILKKKKILMYFNSLIVTRTTFPVENNLALLITVRATNATMHSAFHLCQSIIF